MVLGKESQFLYISLAHNTSEKNLLRDQTLTLTSGAREQLIHNDQKLTGILKLLQVI